MFPSFFRAIITKSCTIWPLTIHPGACGCGRHKSKINFKIHEKKLTFSQCLGEKVKVPNERALKRLKNNKADVNASRSGDNPMFILLLGTPSCFL